MKLKIRVLSMVLILCMALGSVNALAIDITGSGACLMDFDTGQVLYEKNADELRAPASMTKIMTLYIIFEKLADGTLTKETLIPISYSTAALTRSGDATNIPLKGGDSYRVDELIEAIVAVSACACCTAIGEYLAGSEWNFAQMMNAKATELGLAAYFEDASGLSNYNRISPWSMAELVRQFIKRYPDVLNYTSKKTVVIRGVRYSSTNKMLFPESEHYFSFVDGFKTGTTSLAGKCFSSTAFDGNNRLISVTMNSSTTSSRFTDTRKMLDYGFSCLNYYNVNIFSTDIRTYINGSEIPCYYYLGPNSALVLCAEQLAHYGFDVNYVASEHTLYLASNLSKPFAPIAPEENKVSGVPSGKIYNDSNLKVMLVTPNGVQPMKTVISLNGQCCISVDELGSYFAYEWHDDVRHAKITVAY